MDMNEMMKQFQNVQQKLEKMQEDMAGKTAVGSAGGGMVRATVNGRLEVLDITIEKDAINPEEAQMLQDLITAAINDGLRKAKDLSQSELGKLTGGFRIPGLF